jgi:hypothetical protein
MPNDEIVARRITTPARAKTPLEIWTFGSLRAMFRSDQPGLELLPADAVPETPRQGRVVLFARESGAGSGKFQLCAIGPSGSVQILMTEP